MDVASQAPSTRPIKAVEAPPRPLNGHSHPGSDVEGLGVRHKYTLEVIFTPGGGIRLEDLELSLARHEQLVAVYDSAAAADACRARADYVREGEEKRRIQHIVSVLEKNDGRRHLNALPAPWVSVLERLERHFPNFKAVIDFLRGQFCLQSTASRAAMFDPILLDGPPGIGKSYFAEELAMRLELSKHAYGGVLLLLT